MGIAEALSIDGLLNDVQRMDKRQVSPFFSPLCYIDKNITFLFRPNFKISTNLFAFLGFLQFLYQLLSFGMIVSSALMIWKGLMVVTGSESPIVVVLSGSMEPAFHR